MRARALACGVVLGLSGWVGACAGAIDGPPRQAAGTATPAVAERQSDARAAAKLVSRSVWGVVPDAPRYKKDLRPELIRGSAVAVAERTLLASCRVAGKRSRVGLVRHNKYEIARVRAADPERRVCVLELVAGDARPFTPAQGLRSLADLRLGEPVYALVNRTGAEFAVAEGRVTGKRAEEAGRAGALAVSVALPAGARSAVLFDARGNLVGLSSGEAARGAAVAVAAPAAAAPRLANRDLGEADVRLAALPVPPRAGAQVPPPPILFREDSDRDDDDERQPAGVVADAAPSREAPRSEAAEAAGQGNGRNDRGREREARGASLGGALGGLRDAIGGGNGRGGRDRGGRDPSDEDDDHGGRGGGRGGGDDDGDDDD